MPGKFVTRETVLHQSVPNCELGWHSSPSFTSCKNVVVVEAVFVEGKSHAFHRHPNQEEVIYVLEGRIEQWLEKEKSVLGPGESLFIPANVIHATYNVFPAPAKILAILSPPSGESGIETIDMFEQAPWNSLRKK